MKKRIITFFVAVVLCLGGTMSVYAQSDEMDIQNDLPYGIQMIVDMMDFGEFHKQIELFDAEEQIVAYYLEYTNGYFIYDRNGNPVEYSDKCFPSFKDKSESIKIYYLGPFMYYYQNDGEFVNFKNQDTISENDFNLGSDNLNQIIDEQSNVDQLSSQFSLRSSQTPNVQAKRLPMPNRVCNYNDDRTKCCSVAAQDLLYYYSDIKKGCLTNTFFDTNSRSLFNALLSYIQQNGSNCPDRTNPSSPFGTPQSLRMGLNYFLNFQNKTQLRLQDGQGLSIKNLARMVIGSGNVPAIVCYYQNPNDTIGHAVFCYGYRYITINGSKISDDILVNDGWGNCEIYTSIDYAYSFQYLSR